MFDILHEINIDATTNDIYKAITTENGLKSWWTPDAVCEQNPGSIASFGFENRSVIFNMRIDELEKDKLVRWSCLGKEDEWKETLLSWEINSIESNRSQLKFSHTHWKSVNGIYACCNTTWGHLMVLLKYHIEGKPFERYFN